MWDKFIKYVSFEFLLDNDRPNGGDVILLRTLCIAITMAGLTIALRNLIDPELSSDASWEAFRTQLIEIAPWWGAALGAVYAALYTRFSSQWNYLATLYNQIKQVEVETAESSSNETAKNRLAEWKAGYIEDAAELHLHTKRSVAAIICHWGKDSKVKEAFCSASPGGEERWKRLYQAVGNAYANAEAKYQ